MIAKRCPNCKSEDTFKDESRENLYWCQTCGFGWGTEGAKIVYVLVGIWQGTLETVVVYTDKNRAEIAQKNLSRKYGKLGSVTVEEKEIVE